MILLLAGTKDGRELGRYLSEQGHDICLSVTSSYGHELALGSAKVINAAKLNDRELVEFIKDNKITMIVDATHPYAQSASQNALQAAKVAEIGYLRYERAQTEIPNYDKLYSVADNITACRLINEQANWQTVFLTTGSKALGEFAANIDSQKRMIARILPEAEVLREVRTMGFMPRDIIAMQGPFSQEINTAMFKDCKADVIVTKDSGNIGGSDSKIAAAISLGLPIIVICRPKLEYPAIAYSYEAVQEYLQQNK